MTHFSLCGRKSNRTLITLLTVPLWSLRGFGLAVFGFFGLGLSWSCGLRLGRACYVWHPSLLPLRCRRLVATSILASQLGYCDHTRLAPSSDIAAPCLGYTVQFRAYTDPLNASNSLLPPAIPPPPPPPPPLNVPPSRARQLLAARLAMNKRNAEAAGAQENGNEREQGSSNSGSGIASGDGSGGNNSNNSNDDGDISLGAASKSLTAMLDSGGERLRNPFADDEDDDVDADEDADEDEDDDDNDDEDAGLNGGDVGRVGLGWNRGGWWRSMVSRADKGGRSGQAGAGGSSSSGAGGHEKFGDGRDSSSDGGNSSGDDDNDDEEFGDFAMPETTMPAEGAAAKASNNDDDDDNGAGTTAETTAEGSDRETTLFKPLALHPGHSPSGSGSGSGSGSTGNNHSTASAGGSLWRLGFLGTNAATTGSTAASTDTSTSDTNNAKAKAPAASASRTNDDELEVLGDDGHRVARVTEAAHRRSLEDPDEDEVVV
ncbi:uncharacterized protein SPSK_09151 [Sporothrix schenckii 1099-18]|uniref:Uncharacterized protein n=1 Tax=Sporothrix schenckii 1099-18 TaxID=1397361 RepID=A0A0F2M611_SPOSC|nr:uncharacterized protein SPSK_09151 [Sporothrix schenckii 1099-18]KJR84245.1 hypothetical protein SPSK_09151 [Sporothrix schenckii 1099-18]